MEHRKLLRHERTYDNSRTSSSKWKDTRFNVVVAQFGRGTVLRRLTGASSSLADDNVLARLKALETPGALGSLDQSVGVVPFRPENVWVRIPGELLNTDVGAGAQDRLING